MKDFHDIWVLKRSFKFNGDTLGRAIAATFTRRGTKIPADRPDGLSRAFAEDPIKQRQWEAFLQDATVKPPGSLANVVDELVDFLIPAAAAGASAVQNDAWLK
jgi:hypothetical protein